MTHQIPRLRAIARLCPSALAVATTALLFAPSRLESQALTLPTVRAFGPTPEEAALYRLIGSLRASFADDTLRNRTGVQNRDAAIYDRAIRVLPRFDLLTLASVTESQLNALVSAGNETDSLVILAGDKHVASDPIPGQLLAALRAVSTDPSACSGVTNESEDELRKNVTSRVMSVTANSSIPNAQRATLTSNKDSIVARGLRAACAVSPVREREPARQLASAKADALAMGRTEMVAAMDTLTGAATAVIVRRKLLTRWLLPVRGREQAVTFWRQAGASPLNVGGISGSRKNGTVFTELSAPIVKALRMSVNVVLASEETEPETPATPAPSARIAATQAVAAARADEEPAQKNLQRFLNGGGLLNIGLAAPLVNLLRDSDGNGALLLVTSRLAGNAPVLGATADEDATLSVEFGTELHARLMDTESGAGVFARLGAAVAHGSSAYLRTIGITNGRPVGYATALLGFNFGTSYVVTVSKPIGGPKILRRSPVQVGLTLMRGETKR